MKILALASYPERSAATRFRVSQYVGYLNENDIAVTLVPFLSDRQFRDLYLGSSLQRKLLDTAGAVLRRVGLTMNVSSFDLMFVQREAMFFGPAFFEWLYAKVGRLPIVLDLDDATYVAYESPTYGKLGSLLKFFGKTDRLIDRAELVIAGNRFIAEYAEGRGAKTVVIPTIVDTEVFKPITRSNAIPVIGWIGTHSTYQFLRSIFPVLSELAKKHEFSLKIIGAGVKNVDLPGVNVENLEWSLEREVEDFQSFDIGLYPIEGAENLDAAWLAGKSGFKAIQYFAVGVPFVMTPVGVSAEMGEPGVTHFNASTHDDWFNSLDKLLSDQALRTYMGSAGREHSLDNYSLTRYASVLAEALRNVEAKRAR